MSKLYIVRGLPGSGKTTFCKKHFKCLHLEADMFFERDGKYQWDKNGQNHVWCQQMCESALKRGMDVVVSNTFTTHKEIAPYVKMAKENNATVTVIKCSGRFGNKHTVPEETLKRMDERWQDYDGEYDADLHADAGVPVENCIKREDLVDAMRHSKFVRVKDLGNGIESFNYNRKAFYQNAWNGVTTRARGLFVKNDEVYARSFDKFFRLGEVPETEVENLYKSIKFGYDQIEVSRKYNGYLGIVKWDYDNFRFFSKSSTENDYSKRLEYILNTNGFLEKFVQNLMDEHDYRANEENEEYSFVFEVVDNGLDPHLVLNDDHEKIGQAYLIAVFKNTFDDTGLSRREIIEDFGPWIAQYMGDVCAETFSDPNTTLDEFKNRLRMLANCDTVRSTFPTVEGYVVTVRKEDGTVLRFKIKTANYCFWKHVRRFVENPEFDDDGFVRIGKFFPRAKELIEKTSHMDEIGNWLCLNLNKELLDRFIDAGLGGHERINMIDLAFYAEEHCGAIA